MHNNMKVLFATDFSVSSRTALRTAELFNKIYSIELSFVHVLTHFWRYFLSSTLCEKEAVERLKTWQERIDPSNKSENNLHVLIGNAADMILGEAETFQPDLILLGGESVRSKEHFITGTVAEAVVRHAKQPVWLSKNETVSKVICGVDGSKSSAKAMEQAIEICHRFFAELCVIYALPVADFNPLGMAEEEVKRVEEKFKREQIKRIKSFLQQFDFSDLEVRHQFSWGMPARVILDVAEDFDYDLIVIGATGESMLKQVLMGSTAEKTLRHTPCSLLIVR